MPVPSFKDRGHTFMSFIYKELLKDISPLETGGGGLFVRIFYKV